MNLKMKRDIMKELRNQQNKIRMLWKDKLK